VWFPVSTVFYLIHACNKQVHGFQKCLLLTIICKMDNIESGNFTEVKVLFLLLIKAIYCKYLGTANSGNSEGFSINNHIVTRGLVAGNPEIPEMQFRFCRNCLMVF